MQITIEPNKLSTEQLTAIINFLATYPKHATTTHRERMEFEIKADTSDAIKNLTALQDKIKEVPMAPEAAFGGVKIGDQVTGALTGEIIATTDGVNTEIAPGAVVTDRNGLPWDVRIHSSNKQTTADGVWRKRRGIDDATVASVEAELRQVMGAPLAASQPIVNDVPPPPPVMDANAMPPIPAHLVRAPAPPAADARGAYVALVGRTAAAIHQGKITQAQVTQCCSTFGVPALPLLANRLDLVPQIAASIDVLIAGVPL